MSAKPNLEFKKRGNMSCAKKYKDCCALASICEDGYRGRAIVLHFLKAQSLTARRSHDQSSATCRGKTRLLYSAYLGVDGVHVGLGHVTDDNLVIGAVEQLVVFHHSVHSFGHLLLIASGGVAEHFGLDKKDGGCQLRGWSKICSSCEQSKSLKGSRCS